MTKLRPYRDGRGAENISARFVVPTVAAAIDLVVHLEVSTRGEQGSGCGHF